MSVIDDLTNEDMDIINGEEIPIIPLKEDKVEKKTKTKKEKVKKEKVIKEKKPKKVELSPFFGWW